MPKADLAGWLLLARKADVYTQTEDPPFKGDKIWTPMRDQISEPIDTSVAEAILRRARPR